MIFPDSTNINWRTSTDTLTYTYYMNENNSILIEEIDSYNSSGMLLHEYGVKDAQMGTTLYAIPPDVVGRGFTLERYTQGLWIIIRGVEPPPTFIKL